MDPISQTQYTNMIPSFRTTRAALKAAIAAVWGHHYENGRIGFFDPCTMLQQSNYTAT